MHKDEARDHINTRIYIIWLRQLIFGTLEVYVANPKLSSSAAGALDLLMRLLSELLSALQVYLDELPEIFAENFQCLISSVQLACTMGGIQHQLRIHMRHS
ncbi:hypothetical protein M758_12G006000 [Ceratodon purpureus]|nr:hypothetical protein M758_12G006000 [Ceratodon purpureus]